MVRYRREPTGERKILLENPAFEKPVVATAVGEIPDIIVDGEN